MERAMSRVQQNPGFAGNHNSEQEGSTMKHSAKSVVAGALVASMVPMAAQAESPHSFSANVGLFTDYLYRGISQTDRRPAIQGGFDYAYDAGLFEAYAGTWASNVNFEDDDAAPGQSVSVEIDLYGGLAGELFDTGVGWDIGGLYYLYPGDKTKTYDFWEVYGGLDYTFEQFMFEPALGVTVAYSPDFFGKSGRSWYVNPTLEFALPHDFGLAFGYGYQTVKDLGRYSHFSVGVSKDISIFTFDVTYSTTFGESNNFLSDLGNLANDQVVFSISASY
jgi:uncharacterized protein (TIGR02001 family)